MRGDERNEGGGMLTNTDAPEPDGRRLNAAEVRTFVSSASGWALEALDVSSFTYLLPSITIAFAISRGSAGALATVALISSAFGGWFAGMIADRVGRLNVLRATILWFSGFTILCGLAPDYYTFFGLRLLQGIGFGGEWAVGSVMIGEIIRKQWRGRAVGFTQAAYSFGYAAGLGLFSFLYNVTPHDTTWRYMFIVAGLLGLPIFVFRMLMRSPEVPQSVNTASRKTGLFEIFGPALRWRTARASLVCMGVQGGAFSLGIWLPTFLQTVRHLSVIHTTGYLAVYIVGALAGYVCAAYLSDWLGRRRTLMLLAVGAFLAVVSFLFLPLDPRTGILLGLPLGFFTNGLYSPVGPLLTELYPRRLRAAAQGFCYNFGRGVGALFPAMIGFLSQSMGLAVAIVLFSLFCHTCIIVFSALLPELTGIDLETVDHELASDAAFERPSIHPQSGLPATRA
jgi:MFS family permease